MVRVHGDSYDARILTGMFHVSSCELHDCLVVGAHNMGGGIDFPQLFELHTLLM